MTEHATRIEQAARVYLTWNQRESRWEVDPVNFDGDPCAGNDSPHIEWDPAMSDAEAAHISDVVYLSAEEATLPTGFELMRQMAEVNGLKLVSADAVVVGPRDHCRNATPCEVCKAPMGVNCRPDCSAAQIQSAIENMPNADFL